MRPVKNNWRRIAMQFGLFAMLASLGGCFESGYDISEQVKPAWPITPGIYSGQGEQFSVVRSGDRYKATNLKDHQATQFRLYQVPESDSYLIVQTLREDSHRFEYDYAVVSSDKVEFFDRASLPAHLERLVRRPRPDSPKVSADIIDGPRDTLYVLREALRSLADMKKVFTYVLQQKQPAEH